MIKFLSDLICFFDKFINILIFWVSALQETGKYEMTSL